MSTAVDIPEKTWGTDRNFDIYEIPEHLRPREYGKKEISRLRVRNIIRVSQQRGTTNPAFESIRESIDNTDLINQVDVALVTYESLSAYFDFINRLWRSDHHVDDYEPDADGYYHLAIAGHTRLDAIEQIEDKRLKDAVELGYDAADFPEPTVWCKVHLHLEPEDILRLQMDENLHEKPSQERTAIAMVETYYYGLEQGKWKNKKEFINANREKFSRSSLDAALVFSDLHEIIREFVFAGAVPYGPVVELGRTVVHHRRYLARKYFAGQLYDDLSESEKSEIEDEIIKWNAAEVAFIQQKNLNVSASKLHFKAYIANWQSYDPDSQVQDTLFVDPTREWRDRRARTRNKLRQHVKTLAMLPTNGAVKALQLHVEVMDPNTEEGAEILKVIESGVSFFEEKLKRVVGATGSTAVRGGTV